MLRQFRKYAEAEIDLALIEQTARRAQKSAMRAKLAEPRIHTEMKPLWFKAAAATNPGLLVRLGAVGVVLLSVAAAFA